MDESLWTKDMVPGEVELAVWRAGRGSDPVVCLHGITSQHRAFNFLAGEVAGSRGLVGVDLRGRGDSGKPPAGYGLEAHARDLVRVLDHLGLERATVAGHSMGGFIGVKAAMSHPDRIRALVLLDGGWPRAGSFSEASSGEGRREVEEGLNRAFSRLDMTFETPEDYLGFWFPDLGLKMEDLPPELADYYLYDLEEAEGGYRPKASLAAAREDSASVADESPTADEMRRVGCPVALVRAREGFFPGSDPLIPEEARSAMAGALDLRSDTLVDGANHYTLLLDGRYVSRWAAVAADNSWTR